jgi:trans-2,3-dihydro-3-hydroxyanthranilate isomerase
MLGLPESAIGAEPMWVDTGIEQLVIPITSPEHVAAARPGPVLLARWGSSRAADAAMAYLWSRGVPEWTARCFFSERGGPVLEDPATGSACANLGGWMIATRQRLPIAATIRQGDAVERPSRLELRVETSGDIFVTGAVIELGRGSIELAD